MIDEITVEDRPSGRRLLDFVISGDRHTVDEEAIATMGELLGITDAVDAVEAILQIRTGTGIVTLDPRTGEHALTPAYVTLEHRERARENEARKAKEEGKTNDPRSPLLRSALAARRAVMEPVGAESESESLLEIVRGQARGLMGVIVPNNPSVAGRIKPMSCSGDSCESAGRLLTATDREKVQDVLADRVEYLNRWRDQFLHDLSGNAEADPLEDLTPAAPPEPEEQLPDPLSLAGLVSRLSGGQTGAA